MTVESRAQHELEPKKDRRVFISPQTLMEGDPSFALVDLARLGDFNRELYGEGPVHLVRMHLPGTPKDAFVYKVIDGHHRTALASTDPEFEFYGIDITDTKYPGRKYLTPEERRAELQEPSRRHKELYAARTVSHFITDWKGMVGDEIEPKLSVLAVITALGRKQYGLTRLDSNYFSTNLDKDEMPLMADETPERRDRLKTVFTNMADEIISTRLGYDEISLAAFMMVTNLDTDKNIGKAIKEQQVKGLLQLPEINNKIHTPEEHARVETLLLTALDSLKIGDYPDEEKKKAALFKKMPDLHSLRKALLDPEITYDYLTSILQSERAEFADLYRSTKHEITEGKVRSAYTKLTEGVYSEAIDQRITKVTGNSRLADGIDEKTAQEIADIMFESETYEKKAASLLTELYPLSDNNSVSEVMTTIAQLQKRLNVAPSHRKVQEITAGLKEQLAEGKKLLQPPVEEQTIFDGGNDLLEKNTESEEQDALPAGEQIKRTAALLGELLADNGGILFEPETLDALDILRTEIDMALLEGGRPICEEREATPPEIVFTTVKPLDEEKVLDQTNIPWEEVTYDESEGTLSWFQEKDFDSRKATKMLHDRAKKVVTKDAQVNDKWGDLLSVLSYKNDAAEVVYGFDAFEQALVQETSEYKTIDKNVIHLIRLLGLTKESPEVTYLATHFILHSLLLNGDASVKPLKPLLQPIMATISSFQGQRNNKSQLQNGKGEILQHLCYADLTAPESKALIANLLEDPFDANTSKSTLDKARKSHGQVPTLFKKNILKE